MNGRLAAITVAVLAAHAVVIEMAPAWMRPAAASIRTDALVTRTIEASAPATPVPAPAPPPKLAKATPRTPAPRPPAAAPEPSTATPAPAPEPPKIDFTPGVGFEVAQAPVLAASAAATPQAYAIPEPVRMRYEVTADTRFGISVSSTAVLTWKHDGVNYEAQLEAGGGMLPKRVQRSTGQITPEGLAPQRFSDKSRSEQATHFEREKGKVTFSNNKPEAALAAGMQDRLSVIVQLAAMVGGAPARYPQGASIAIPTAGTSEAETWTFTVEGEEELQLPVGKLKALKLQRMPRREYDVKVELWLAPGLDYAPVRLRLTNPNGESVDQRWAGADRG